MCTWHCTMLLLFNLTQERERQRERGECAALWENERGGHWWLVYSLHRSVVLMHQTHSFVLWVNTLSRHDTSSHTLGYVDSYRFRDWTQCRGRRKLPARELLPKLHRAVATHQQLRRKCITLICSHRREWGSVCGEWTWFLNFLNLWEFERWWAGGGGWRSSGARLGHWRRSVSFRGLGGGKGQTPCADGLIVLSKTWSIAQTHTLKTQ